MPKRNDIHTILIIGSGPIVIGQGCEFDYSGTQACKALREEGYRVVLVNSNPATIMTDPAFADRTYIEPITPEAVTRIIEAEAAAGNPIDALLPTLGGQTALNCACRLFDSGILAKHKIEMIGANRQVIHRAEDRQVFRDIVEGLGLKQPLARTVNTMDEAWAFLDICGLPAIIRPAFTLGGSGGGIAYNREEFEQIIRRGLDASMIKQVLIDQSVLGWKEYELEVMRDRADNVVIICGIENIDPMGVHTGDSITVAPIQTLTDREYQRMRDASMAIIRAVGVETGGCNIQFAIDPVSGEMVVVEMNPRVSRSSALASKATGFAIAKIAAKLAVGYTLDELPNDITGKTVACFEPTIDYVVTKIPRWTFEKFPEADETLTTQMKSVGEAMSIGRTFRESFQKGIRSMEVKRFGFGLDRNDKWLSAQRSTGSASSTMLPAGGSTSSAVSPAPPASEAPEFPIGLDKLRRKLSVPSQGRPYYIRYAFKMGWTIEQVFALTKIDPWFLDQLKQLVDFEDVLCAYRTLDEVPAEVLWEAKRSGYSDAQLANLYLGAINVDTILAVRARRKALGIEPVYKLVDTCAAEFEAATPYYYSTYERPFTVVGSGKGGSSSTLVFDDEVRVTDKKKIVILGGGPNRIGQGIEFDYCCVQAAYAAQELGFESVMINSNPETVSTDYDTSDLLFFEPLTLEDVLNICERLNGAPLGQKGNLLGAIVQFGGQTPLNLAHGLQKAGVPIIGTSVDSIDHAEDRDRFAKLLKQLQIRQPDNGIARSLEQAIEIAQRIGYPVLVRPSYVLGGRGMETCFHRDQLLTYMKTAVDVSELANAPVLIDRFLSEAIECDVDVVADFHPANDKPTTMICGVMEHIEEAGIHSGDSACAIPPFSLPQHVIDSLIDQSRRLAEALKVCGLMNVQYAITRPSDQQKDYEIHVLEVNPRASRTVPFVSKATGVSWARVAAKVMAGQRLIDLDVSENLNPPQTSVKESVFPFSKFPGVDIILGPEMRSTGEVMGVDAQFPIAFAKSQMAAGGPLPTGGKVFLSVRESDKKYVVALAQQLLDLGFAIVATGGTHRWLKQHGIEVERVNKISEGRPNALDVIKNGELTLIFNTPTRKGMTTDEGQLRAAAVRFNVPIITTMTGAMAAVKAIAGLRGEPWGVRAVQDYYPVYRNGDLRKGAELPA
jgi:carbamoyl-phosphate synthase large subunit